MFLNLDKFLIFNNRKKEEQNIQNLVDQIKKNVRDTREEYTRLTNAFEELKILYYEKTKSEKLFRVLGEISLLLLHEKSVEKQLNKICFLLGTSSNSDRCYLFKNKEDYSNAFLFAEWCDTNFCVPKDSKKDLEYIDFSTYRWFKGIIDKRETVSAAIDNIPDENFRKVLKKFNVKSILISPIYTNGHCWGFLGLDSCKVERKWNSPEIYAINIITNIIGTALQREKFQKN